jgi:hypothetical protein
VERIMRDRPPVVHERSAHVLVELIAGGHDVANLAAPGLGREAQRASSGGVRSREAPAGLSRTPHRATCELEAS